MPLVLGLTGLIPLLLGLVLAGGSVAGGSLLALNAYRELANLRRLADVEIEFPRALYLHSALVAWRSAELVSARHRAALARSMTQTVRDLSPARLPGASPLNRIAARPEEDLLLRVAARLGNLARPVTPRGVLAVERLLTSADSPLYAPDRARLLRRSLLSSLDALDGVPRDSRREMDQVAAVAR